MSIGLERSRQQRTEQERLLIVSSAHLTDARNEHKRLRTESVGITTQHQEVIAQTQQIVDQVTIHRLPNKSTLIAVGAGSNSLEQLGHHYRRDAATRLVDTPNAEAGFFSPS